MEFEYDPNKSKSNFEKHGVDFEHAKRLFDDLDAYRVQATSDVEPRYAVFGMMDGKHWTAIITYRESRIRIISVRRSRGKEVDIYEEHKRRRA